MSTKSDELMTIVTNKGCVTLREVLDNLQVLQVEVDAVRIAYFVTRVNKDIPWPAPYQAGERIDGEKFHCCSYSTLDDEYPIDDAKILNVYRVFDEE